MKKFLSLVLALVMTMSLVTISAGAEFTDDTTVNYDEAVDVISALGIVGGYPDGSFKPQNTLTRGAAAKIICIMTLGADVAAALPTNVASYTDVPAGSTYAGYIAYLKNAGVISGYADGSYKPGVTLTGYAFLKMLLGALGYDQTIEGYVGENWQIAVAKRAKELKLFDDNKNFNGNVAATREEACLYALQTLMSNPVSYDGGSSLTVNGISFVTGAELVVDDTQLLYEKNFDDLDVDTSATDAVGRPAVAYSIEDKDIGTYADSPKKVYTAEKVKEKTVYSDLGLTETTNFKLFQDGNGIDDDDYYVQQQMVKNSSDYIFSAYNVNGMVLEFYKSAKKVIALTPKVLEVTDVTEADGDDARYITLSDGSTYETEDFAENDMVLCYTHDGDKAADVKAAEKLTGKVTKISGDAIWVDGTKYTKSATAWAGNNIDACAVKDEVEFYLDDAGYIVKLDANVSNVSTTNVAFVEKSGKQSSGDYDGTNTYKATLRYADGTKEIVVLKNAVQADDGINDPYGMKIVTYKTSSSKIILANDSDKLYTYSGASFTKGQPVVTTTGLSGQGLPSFPVTASTKFVYVEDVGGDDEAVATYTGFKNAPDFGANNTMGVMLDKDGKAVLVYVYANFVSAAAETASYVIYNDDLTIIADEDSDGYYETIMINAKGETETVKIDDSVWTGALNGAGTVAVALKSYTVDKDGFIDSVDVASGSDYNKIVDKTATYVKGDEIVTIGGQTYTYDENTVVYKINDDKDTVTTTTIEKVANNTNSSKNYDGIGVGVTEKNAAKLAVVFLYEK